MQGKSNTFSITSAHPEDHLMPISRIISNAFAGGGALEEILQKYVGGCHYDFDTTRLAWEGEQLVHHWGVWGYWMRVGSVQLKTAGIGAVVTEESYRKQGLMASAAAQSFQAMYDHGYDLSILRGRHYHKFGYRRAWNYVTTKLDPGKTPPEQIPQVDLKLPFRLLDRAEMDPINALYNRDYAGFSGSCVRPTFPMFEDGDMKAYGWYGQQGQLAGYVRAAATEDQSALLCLEATGDPQQGLAVLRELMQQEACHQLHFFTMPEQHPILQIVRQGACTVENRYFHHTGWQVRLVNLTSSLQKLLPLLVGRLAASRFAKWQGRLHLDAGEQQAALRISNGRIQLTDENPGEHRVHGGWAIARLLIGSDEPGEIARQEGITFTGEAEALVEVLFPNLHPMMSHWDEF